MVVTNTFFISICHQHRCNLILRQIALLVHLYCSNWTKVAYSESLNSRDYLFWIKNHASVYQLCQIWVHRTVDPCNKPKMCNILSNWSGLLVLIFGRSSIILVERLVLCPDTILNWMFYHFKLSSGGFLTRKN